LSAHFQHSPYNMRQLSSWWYLVPHFAWCGETYVHSHRNVQQGAASSSFWNSFLFCLYEIILLSPYMKCSEVLWSWKSQPCHFDGFRIFSTPEYENLLHKIGKLILPCKKIYFLKTTKTQFKNWILHNFYFMNARRPTQNILCWPLVSICSFIRMCDGIISLLRCHCFQIFVFVFWADFWF
jgi:hypothetical protein